MILSCIMYLVWEKLPMDRKYTDPHRTVTIDLRHTVHFLSRVSPVKRTGVMRSGVCTQR